MKIERVAIPPMGRQGIKCKYPWPDMKDGDSVLVPRTTTPRAKIAARAWVRRNRPGWKVVTRAEGDGVRIWFVAPENERNGDTR